MDYNYPHTLPGLELSVGPNASTVVRLDAPVELQVEFLHDAGCAPVPTLANGDPGEPGAPEEFDFKRIITPRALFLPSASGKRLFLVDADEDIYDLLDADQVTAIQYAMLAQLRAEQDQRQLDAALGARA